MPADAEVEAQVEALRRAGDLERAAERLLAGYGRELFAFLAAHLGDADDADDAFAMLCEDVWRGLPAFRGESSCRTWAYRVARHAASRLRRTDRRRRQRISPGGTSAADRLAWQGRTATAPFQRTDVKDRVRALRAALADDERELLALRVDRGLEWNEIVQILNDGETPLSAADATRAAAVLRKRFERTKERLRALAKAAGLLPE